VKIATTITPINLAGIVSAAAYIYLALHSQSYAEVGLVEFWRASGVCILMCFATWYYYHKTGRPISVTSLLAWALIFRCIGVFAYPILEDDFFRYLWDARMLVEYGSPYGVAPADSFSVDEPSVRFEEILGSINYPDISTVYGPVTQWSFAFGYLLAPGQLWPLQLLYAALDFSIIILLLRLAPAKYVLLYAWCPLLIKEFSFTAHPDILGVFFMLAAIIMIRKDCWYRAALLLALAVGSKIFALLMVPLLIGLRWRIWLLFGVTLLCITLPFLPTNPWLNGGLGAMTDLWLFNAPIYLALSPLVSGTWIKLSLLLTFILIWCAYAVHHFRTGNG
jgi:alpha-1,6-mannosyltransferase